MFDLQWFWWSPFSSYDHKEIFWFLSCHVSAPTIIVTCSAPLSNQCMTEYKWHCYNKSICSGLVTPPGVCILYTKILSSFTKKYFDFFHVRTCIKLFPFAPALVFHLFWFGQSCQMLTLASAAECQGTGPKDCPFNFGAGSSRIKPRVRPAQAIGYQ